MYVFKIKLNNTFLFEMIDILRLNFFSLILFSTLKIIYRITLWLKQNPLYAFKILEALSFYSL